MEKRTFNIDPYTFTGSAVVIGLVSASELSELEQDSIGNWLQLVGLTIQTYGSQKAVVNENNGNNKDDFETLKKAIERIEKELENLAK